MPGWIIALIVALVVVAVACAVWLMDDGASREFRKRIDRALAWWSHTDDRFRNLGRESVSFLLLEVEDLLKYPEYIATESADKLQNLRDRLNKVKDGK